MANESRDRCSAESGLLLVIWDRMPNTQEIPALRRMLELSLAEFWMVLITYWHSSEAGAQVSFHRRLQEDWEVLFWRDASQRSGGQDIWSSAQGVLLEGSHRRLAHQCFLNRAFSWKKSMRIVAPVDRRASTCLPASGGRQEARLDATKYAKDEEAQIVRLDELLDQFRRSPLSGETLRK